MRSIKRQLVKSHALRHMLHEQQGGYFIVPALIMLILSTVAATLPIFEQRFANLDLLVKQVTWFAPTDPNMAQIFLGATAGSCITVVSIVYSVLLIALTFASIQFSPRILTSFLKDRISQGTLGLFIGTFSYCLVLLPSIRTGANQSVPKLSMMLALLLATLCLFFLVYFIHHIAVAIQVNYIIDKIARETEGILRSIFGGELKGFPPSEESFEVPENGRLILATKTGYVQFIDEEKLFRTALKFDTSVFVHRVVGQFVPAGVQIITVIPPAKSNSLLVRECLSCFYIGPVRSMENDVEFGILQLVDIALKAISPAVNDPSTAIACIDHLSGILLLAATLKPPSVNIVDDAGVVRVLRRQPSFSRLLEIAYDQIIPYGRNDMAVSLRLMRALYDISGATNYLPYLTAIRNQATAIVQGCSKNFSEQECSLLNVRLSIIETRQRSRT